MKPVFKWLIFAVILLLARFDFLKAGDDAGRESQFSIGSGVRAVSMGGGFVGLADDASAIYWNQAAMTLLDNQEFNLMHVTLFEGSAYDVASFVYPNPRLGGFGFSFMRLGTGDITRRQNWDNMGEFSFATWQFMIGYGRKLEGGHAIGSALKIVNQNMTGNSTYGFGLDLSFYSRIKGNLGAGITFQDIIAPRLRLGSELEIIPTTVIAGAGLKDIKWGKDFRHNIGVGVEKAEDRSMRLHLGAESILRNILALRAGYDRDNMTFGLGIYYRRLRFDYAYKFMDGINDSHRLGLSVQVGTSVSDKLRKEREYENARGSSLILEDRRRQFRLFKEEGDRYYRANDFDSAYNYYQRAMAFNEGDRDVTRRLDQILELRRAAEKLPMEKQPTTPAQILLDNYYSQAEALNTRGSYAAALDLVNLGLGTAPADSRFLKLRDRIFEGRDAEIRKFMDEAMRAEREGRYADAITSYNRVMELSPNNAAVKQLIAKTGTEMNKAQLISKGAELFTMGNLSDSKRRFDEVLKLDPQNPVARDYLDRISVLMKEATELEDLQKDEKVWKIYLTALESFRNGDYENAINLWQEVLKYYPGNKNTLNNIEQAKLRMGRK